jgi:hypothetical protein
MAEPFIEPEPRQWPKVLGVLAALWGAMGLVSSSLAVAGIGQEAQPPIMRGGVGSALSAVTALLAQALVAGGVQLLRRRPSGVQLIRAWVPLSALAQGAVLAVMLTHRDAFEQAFREEMERQAEARAAKSGQAAPVMPQGMERLMFSAGVGCGGIAAVVPPAIVAFFVFGRRGREALAEWSAPGVA